VTRSVARAVPPSARQRVVKPAAWSLVAKYTSVVVQKSSLPSRSACSAPSSHWGSANAASYPARAARRAAAVTTGSRLLCPTARYTAQTTWSRAGASTARGHGAAPGDGSRAVAAGVVTADVVTAGDVVVGVVVGTAGDVGVGAVGVGAIGVGVGAVGGTPVRVAEDDGTTVAAGVDAVRPEPPAHPADAASSTSTLHVVRVSLLVIEPSLFAVDGIRPRLPRAVDTLRRSEVVAQQRRRHR
jgi:hypothetical protein